MEIIGISALLCEELLFPPTDYRLNPSLVFFNHAIFLVAYTLRVVFFMKLIR